MNYTDPEKANIVAQRKKGISVNQLSSQYGISVRTIYRWSKLYCEANPGEKRTFTIKEHDMLQRRVSKLENIITILKTVNCTVSAPLKEKLDELEKLYGQYDVHTLCEALEVSRGTFYNHILRNKRGNAWFAMRREEYRILIQEVFDEFQQVPGAEKLCAILVQRGHKVSKKYVADLMREMGLISIRTASKQDWLKWNKPKRNVVQQQFQVAQPNRTWVSDVTCFKLNERYYYVCVILDLYSRMVIAYKIPKKNSTQLITGTFKSAYKQRIPSSSLIFHSDRGSQYTSNRFQKLLQEYSVTQSFSNSGKPHDNAVAESFFASLKKEELYRKNYRSEKELMHGIDSYIRFYNQKRPHRTLNNLSPCQFEEKFLANRTSETT